jgi:hypothetical protein
VAIYAAILLAGCVVNRAEDVENAQTKIVGLSQGRLFGFAWENRQIKRLKAAGQSGRTILRLVSLPAINRRAIFASSS